ncbi:hypothetical protein IMG5_130830 [Ichthyophthirius multifiliis]|uniref:Calpain catalytic domain-containing protein n=1 Tax=Ichthyophthirius multifiliis TaxID=5932 RepID=G0QWB9_ICHMU|nr:hypothetical protein IMG5_130830 [Ichthyophthirius multifiliis]EGR30491.1 hypothetical protein IMG5_130830 [Ichthyophthirius multifiliis]|eukprot:XP_004032078.1 hypothetical protein IMG5_130830 [Ichthyophthirius multifiliis]
MNNTEIILNKDKQLLNIDFKSEIIYNNELQSNSNLRKTYNMRKRRKPLQLQQSSIQQTFNQEYGTNTVEYDIIIEECQHALNLEDKIWTDKSFPARRESLCKEFNKLSNNVQNSWRQITWKRPSEFLNSENIKLFDVIEPDDIKQGLLGDCYLLCALSALAEQQELVERLFHVKVKSDYGIYSIWLNIDGEWKNINIDDQIPYKGRQPAFSRGQGDEIWVLLLEKAYAKAYGSYYVIEGGNPAQALRDLTGAPYENVDNISHEEFWKYLEENDNEKNVLTCYTKQTEKREEENQLGLLSGHAYSILDHKNVIDSNGEEGKIVKIRNPWGNWQLQSQKRLFLQQYFL